MNVAGRQNTVSTAPDMPMILLALALLMVGLVLSALRQSNMPIGTIRIRGSIPSATSCTCWRV